MPYEFGAPAQDVLLEVAGTLAANQHLGAEDVAAIRARICADPNLASIRQVERLVTETYVRRVTGRP